MTDTKPKAKPIERVVAIWPNQTREQALGDRNYGNCGGCDSLWLKLRIVDDDSFEAYKLRNVMSNIGLWIWWSTTSDSISVEFKAHDVFSATVQELEAITAELRRLNKRIPQRLHAQSYGLYVIAVLKAAGFKRCVEYRGIGIKDEYVPLERHAHLIVDEIHRRNTQPEAKSPELID